MRCELVLVRHAETTASRAGRYLGWGDAPLTAAGEAEARRLADRLAGRGGAGAALPGAPPDLVVASDLPRALRTAALALPDARVAPDPRLRELHFGAFEGATWRENLARRGESFRAWLADPRGVAPPGGERLDELEARVADWMRGLPRTGRVIAFLHGGSLRAALAIARGRRTEELLGVAVPPCAVVVLGDAVLGDASRPDSDSAEAAPSGEGGAA